MAVGLMHIDDDVETAAELAAAVAREQARVEASRERPVEIVEIVEIVETGPLAAVDTHIKLEMHGYRGKEFLNELTEAEYEAYNRSTDRGFRCLGIGVAGAIWFTGLYWLVSMFL